MFSQFLRKTISSDPSPSPWSGVEFFWIAGSAPQLVLSNLQDEGSDADILLEAIASNPHFYGSSF